MYFNFTEQLEQDARQFNIGTNRYFTLQEGDNRIRVLSPAVAIGQHFMGVKIRPELCVGVERGCPLHENDEYPVRPKWLVWVWDYNDEAVKLARLPYGIIRSIASLQKHQEYGFSSLPMPYDITIQAKGAGTRDVKYTVLPARSNTEVMPEAMARMSENKNIFKVVEDLKNNVAKKYLTDSSEEINTAEIFGDVRGENQT